MPDQDAVLATPAPPQDSPTPATPAPAAAPSGTPSATPSEPFLVVSERQKYQTREEAQKAYLESGTRIAHLSKWEETAKEYGVEDPAVVKQLFDELLQFRATQAAKPAAPAPADQLPPEWQQARDYMIKQGIVPDPKKFESILAEIESIKQGQQGEQSARVEAAQRNGEVIFQNLLKESGLVLDEAASTKMRDRIEDAIVRESRDASNRLIPDSPEDRFLRGDAAERSAVIKEQFQWFTQFGDLYAKRQTAALVDQKAAAQAASPRPLPASNSPVPVPQKPGQGFRDAGLNQRVQAIMEAEAARRGGPLL